MDLEREVTVTCECGAKYKVSGLHVTDSIACNVCGRRVVVHRADHKQITDTVRHGNVSGHTQHPCSSLTARVAEAVHLAKEHQYEAAIQRYEDILKQEAALRDVLYGLGYCHYRLNNHNDSRALLRLARDLGHTSAADLLMKLPLEAPPRNPD